VLTIAGVEHWLWRAVDQNGMVLDILVQSRRDTRAAKRLLRKLLKKQTRPLECAPDGGQIGRFELTFLAGLPEDGSHDEAPLAQRRVQAAGC
jgi:hypothetical protein